MTEIRKTGLFKKVRHKMQTKKMFFPDQTALNKLAVLKRIAPRRFFVLFRLLPVPVFLLFSSFIRFFPYFLLLSVDPWGVVRVLSVLHLHEYDDLLTTYLKVKNNL